MTRVFICLYICITKQQQNNIMSIYKQQKLNSINTITIEIEETFSNDYSIVAYDENNCFFIEKFAKDLPSAKIIADKILVSKLKEYTI